MRRPALNLTAGFLASGIATLAGLLVVPVYLRQLGTEGYGFVALFLTLQALLQVFDIGLTATVSRQVAQARARGAPDALGPMLHAFGWLAWGVACALTVLLLALAPVLAHHWLRLEAVPPAEATTALLVMALALGLRWPAGLYQSVLLGADRLARASFINAAMTIVGHGGAALVLWAGGGRLLDFFGWQLGVALLHVLWVRHAAQQVAPAQRLHWPAFHALGSVGRFSLGMTGIGVTGLALMQVDKVILSRMLSLADFGHYMVAWLVAGGLYALVMPVFQWAYPHLTQLGGRDAAAMEASYRLVSHALACLILPLAMLVVVSGDSLLLLWLRDARAAGAVAPLLSLLAVGSALHCMMYLPYALALAKGATGVALRINLALLVLLVPAIIVLTARFGAVGAAAAWLGLHVTYLVLGSIFSHAVLLPAARWTWLSRDIGPGLAAAVAIGLPGSLVAQGPLAGATALQKAAWGIALCLLAWAVCVAASGRLRRLLASRVAP